MFGYSDEDGTEAASLPGKLDEDVIRERVELVTALVDEVMSQRAEDRIGQRVMVLVEALDVDEDDQAVAVGRAGHQGPDDSSTIVRIGTASVAVGEMIAAEVVDVEGVDLLAELVESSA